MIAIPCKELTRRVENSAEFNKWLQDMIEDSKKKLHMTNATIAYILLHEGLNYYLKTICKGEL